MKTISDRRHPDPSDTNGFVEPKAENRYENNYRVDFRDGRKSVFGHVSSVEARMGYFLFLERGAQDQLGMVGINGIRYNFDEVKGVFEEDRQNPGYYGGDEQIAFWKMSAGIY